LPADVCTHAISDHWSIEDPSHYGRWQLDSRIRHNPGVFARLRPFAASIRRFNGVENVSDARYRITLSDLDALWSLRFM
jgi:hypothetical protein